MGKCAISSAQCRWAVWVVLSLMRTIAVTQVKANAVSYTQVLAMEEHLLNVLGFELTVPTAKTFLRRFVQAAMHGGEPNLRLEHLASYLTELALLEYGEHPARSMTHAPHFALASCGSDRFL